MENLNMDLKYLKRGFFYTLANITNKYLSLGKNKVSEKDSKALYSDMVEIGKDFKYVMSKEIKKGS